MSDIELGAEMFRYLILFSLVLTGCDALPWMEKCLRLPDKSADVCAIIRADGEYRTEVKNAYGRASISHSPIGDNDRWTNLYLTSENRLVTIEAAGDSAMFDVSPGKAPRALPLGVPTTMPREQVADYVLRFSDASDRWRYLGVIARGREGIAYYPPKDAPECIPLLGVGFSHYRKKYQVEHFCPHPLTDDDKRRGYRRH